jgi:hypothetical protein
MMRALFLLLTERFAARLLGVAPPWDVDDELLGPDSNDPSTATASCSA